MQPVLTPLFDSAYQWFQDPSRLGVDTPDTFSYDQGTLAFSTNLPVIIATAVYLGGVVGFGQYAMKSQQQSFSFPRFAAIHNLGLSIFSAVLLGLMLETIVPIVAERGLFYGICSKGAYTPRLALYYYINYLAKYYEQFVDTGLLVLKKKKLGFLHVYHHAATTILCYTQLNGETTVSWVPITLNLFVHMGMYYYYYLSTIGKRVWWKKYVTTFQIAQFVIDLVTLYFAFYQRYATQYNLPNFGDCNGTNFAAYVGVGILTSYLFLFLEFYYQTYSKASSVQKCKKTR